MISQSYLAVFKIKLVVDFGYSHYTLKTSSLKNLWGARSSKNVLSKRYLSTITAEIGQIPSNILGNCPLLILLNFIFRIGDIVWTLTSINPKDRLSAEQLLDEEFSDKDIKVVERDKEMDGLKDTIRLQTQQITKQEELIAQQNKELLILRKLLQRVRNENEDL